MSEGALLDVQQHDLNDPPRYALHPLVRAFASRQLAAQPQLAHAPRIRQMDWYAALTATVSYCWDDLSRLAVLDLEQETVTALIHWGMHEDAPALTQLVRGVDYFHYIRGLWGLMPELGAVREAAARAADDMAEAIRVQAYQLQMRCRQNQLADVEKGWKSCNTFTSMPTSRQMYALKSGICSPCIGRSASSMAWPVQVWEEMVP